jgi:hypothetical protein
VEGEFVVEGEVDDLAIVDTNCEQRVLVVFVGDLEVVRLLCREEHQHCRIGSFLLEVWFLRSHGDRSILIFSIIEGEHLDLEFVQRGSIGSSDMEVDLGSGWIYVHEFGGFLCNKVILGNESILEIGYGFS